MKKIEILSLSNGHKPYLNWLDDLDFNIQAKISKYVDRVARGGSKANIRALGQICEIKIDIGPGYRVYFGEVDNIIILLLLGGDKRSQMRDILMAKQYWREYVQKRRI